MPKTRITSPLTDGDFHVILVNHLKRPAAENIVPQPHSTHLKKRILLFEWLLGGGRLVDGDSPDANCPFESQGLSMLCAVAKDFIDTGLRPVILVDYRMKPPINIAGSDFEWHQVQKASRVVAELRRLAKTADHLLLIAPESAGRLVSTCEALHDFEDKFISPDIEFVRLASDKTKTCTKLEQQGISVPPGISLKPQSADQLSAGQASPAHPPKLTPPLILKPNFGAGGEALEILHDESWIARQTTLGDFRIEEWIAGKAVSVSVICGSRNSKILTPTGQVFSPGSVGNYREAEYPLPTRIANRAVKLAEHVVNCFRPKRGYFGIDMVIGDNGNDYVIEVNPRLTSSYIKLREIESFNLAAAMLD